MDIIRKYIGTIRAFCKRVDSETYFTLMLLSIILFTGLSSFALGRLSVAESNKEGIAIEYTLGNTQSSDGQVLGLSSESESIVVVASQNGKRYHYPWCPGAKQISEANKLGFSSTEEAERAGYTLALNCKRR